MCHEKYHVDPDLRAIANRLTGLPLAVSSSARDKCLTAARLLLDTACCEGLLALIDSRHLDIQVTERSMLSVRLRAIRERLGQTADAMLGDMLAEDSVPF